MRKNKGKILPYFLAAFISGIIFIATAGFLFADLFFSKDEVRIVDIPSFVGMSEDDIPREDIEFEKSYAFSDNVDKGIVIFQSRRGKVKIPVGEKLPLKITVSLGREAHILPELAGVDLYEASGIIREMGCVPRTVFSESEKAPDTVLYTLPAAGSELHKGDTVTVYVATRSAPRTVCVPDFYGCSLDNLQGQVEDAGLTLGKIEFIYSEDFLPNTVIYQSIGKGCLVKPGERVDFYISRSPEI